MKLLIILSMAILSFSSFADDGVISLVSKTTIVRVSSGWGGTNVTVNGSLAIPMTELAAAKVLELKEKGKFNCEVKAAKFENGGHTSSGEGIGANMLYAIDNCTKVEDVNH